jgi:hypothetical protein
VRGAVPWRAGREGFYFFPERNDMLKSCIGGVLAVLMVVGFTGVVRAADEKKADATGTWKWEMKRQNGDAIPVTLKLKQDGEKLTGTISGFGANAKDTEITDGTIKDGDLSFKVTRKRNDQEFTTTYKGKLAGDTITGKTERPNQQGEVQSRDWEAKREKA